MIISGTIIAVEKPDYTDPQYGNQYQNITIETRDGEITGRIGCKKPYTKQDQLSKGQWELEVKTNAQGEYNRLKKYYAQPYTPPQGQTRRPAASSEQKVEEKVDWDAKDLRMARMSGLNNATRLVCLLAEMEKDVAYLPNASASPDTIKTVAAEFVDYIYNGLNTEKLKKKWNPEDEPIRNPEVGREPGEDDVPY